MQRGRRPRGAEAQRARRLRPRLLVAVFALLLLPVSALSLSQAATTGDPQQVGQWGPVVNWPTMGKHLALLPTNEVLAFSTGANAHVWDLGTNTWTAAPFGVGDLHCAGHSALADGRLIVVGGVHVTPQIGIKITAIFDPWTNTWANKAPMKYARWYPTTTTLQDGRILATSGTNESKVKVPIPEIYDPATDTWTELPGANRVQPFYPFTYVLPDGRIYEAAPKRNTMFLNVSGSGSWSAGPDNGWETLGCCTESGVMFRPGEIMRSGGSDPAIARTGVVNMNAASPRWQETAAMAFPRRRHNTLLLADGQVMAIGGTRQGDDATQAVLEGEIWNPDTKTWTTVAPLAQPRMYHSAALLLPDGRVVVAGGDTPHAGKQTAQIYSPPYLFRGARPVIASAPSGAGYGSSFTVTTDATDISSVALIGSGAMTHSIDMNTRYVPLPFTQSGGDLTVDAPPTANHAPPGYYMLVIENAAGVPSVAAWIQISAAGGGTTPPPPPTLAANFTAAPTTGAPPHAVQFTDTSTGSPTSWEWDFQNDGVVDSTVQNPQFTYSTEGVYTVKLTVRKDAARDEEVKTNLITVSTATSSTLTFSPDADARVQESNPGTNYGTSYLRADGATDPDVESYLRFNVTGVAGIVTTAKLRVYATSSTSNGPAVYAADSGWSETGINWSNRPVRGATAAADKAGIAGNSWVEWDVTSLVTGNGSRTFVLATNTTDGVNLNSREATTASLRPQLVLTVGPGAPTAPTANFTATPTTGTAPLTVKFTDISTGGATEWAWDFDNDGGFDSIDQNPEVTYNAPGAYSVRLVATNEEGSDEEVKVGLISVVAEGSGPPVTFTPVADAHVKSDAATSNTGSSSQLRVDAVPAVNTYLKFDVSGLSAPPSSAILSLYVVDPNPNGGSAYAVSNSWTESSITWNTAPPIGGTALSSVGSTTAGTRVQFDVTRAITGNGTFSLALKGPSSDTVYYGSRESANKPQLTVTP